MTKLIQKVKEGFEKSELINSTLVALNNNFKESDFYFVHPLRTALILKEMGVVDARTIAAGILHHLPRKFFNLEGIATGEVKEVLNIRKKVKRLREICSYQKSFKPKPIKKWQKIFLDTRAENLRKMVFVITRDLRPIFVILAGRLDEMRNLQSFPKDHQPKDYVQRKSLEALEILSPLAYGVGIGEVKGELEDLAFPYLYAKEYQWLRESVRQEYSEREKHLEKIKPQFLKMLKGEGIKVLHIDARAKHYFSLYQKLLRYNMDLEKIYDLVALRVVVPDVDGCYKVLGIVHNVWPPLSGRIKDYISSPKPNGYRALHTTVNCPDCREPLEIQILTPEMWKEARYGLACHLSYKEEIPKKTYRHQFFWLDQLRRWQEEIKDIQKVSVHLKSDLFRDRIFVFSPKRDVFDLPKGSTPIDFAYAVHTEIGDHTESAKVNGKIIPLNQALQTGQTIEILTDKNKTPSSDWLRFVKTAKARAKIRSFLEAVYGISPRKPKRKTTLREKVSIIKKILPIRRKGGPQILVAGESGISVKLSKCCSPNQGDKISAFITKGEGASLHKIDCVNLKELKQKWPQRIVKATWSSGKRG